MFSPSKCSLLSTAACSSSTKMVFRPCLKMTCTPASMAAIYCSQPRCHSNTSGSPPPRNCCPVLPTLVPSRSEVISSRPQSVLPEDVHSPPSAVTPVAGLNPSDISYRYAPAHMDHESLETTGFLRLLRLPPPRPTRAGLRRPDLLFHHPDRDSFLIDVTIVADNADLVAAQQHKTVYYDTDDIRHWISTNVSTKPLHVSSVTLNWRGLLCAASAAPLCNDLKLKKPVLSLCRHLGEGTVDMSTF